MDIVFLIVGIIIGATLSFFIIKSIFTKREMLEQSGKASLESQIQQLNTNLDEYKSLNSAKDNDILQLNRELSEKKSDLNHLNEKLKEQKDELNKIQEQFKLEFKNLANEILENNSKKFSEENKTKLGELLKPLGEKIKDFEKKVEETYDKESKLRFSLKEEIKRLEELNQQVSKDAVNLTKALKGDSKTQGDWGEMILESILEQSGLTLDREYFKQSNFKNEEGKNVRPDFVIKYPGDRNVVIDSKVSLTAYDRYMSSENEAEKEKAIREHLLSVRNHVKGLSEVNYQDLYDLNSLDFVMMFMPVEPSYLLAMQHDPKLWHDAYKKRVLIISPTNLIAALKMIESLWRQEYQTKNVQEIAKQVGLLYDKFVGHMDDLIKVGKKMEEAQNAYENSMKKLYTGPGNIIKKVNDIKNLGIKTSKELPQKLVDRVKNNE